MENEQEKKLSFAEKQAQQIQDRLSLIHDMRGLESEFITGYVYRENLNKTKTSLPPIDSILLDHEFGPMHGPGDFLVMYFEREDFDKPLKFLKSISYKIGREYSELHREFCRETGRPCYLDSNNQIVAPMGGGSSLSELLEPEKMKAAAGFLGALKIILAPSQNDNATTKLLMEQNNNLISGLTRQQTQSATNPSLELLTNKAIENLFQPKKEPDLHSQIKMIKEINELITPATEQAEKSEFGMYENLISKAMDNLPAILEQFKGNVKQAAQHVKKENPLQALILKNNKKLQMDFYTAMSKQFGKNMADKWAAEYGINTNNIIPFYQEQEQAQAPVNAPAQRMVNL